MTILILAINIQYSLMLITFLYGLVAPSHVCNVSGWPQALFYEQIIFFEKARFGPKPCLLRFRLAACALLFDEKDMHCWKNKCFLAKTSFWWIFVNIWQCRSISVNENHRCHAFSLHLCRHTHTHLQGDRQGNIVPYRAHIDTNRIY